MDQNENGVLEVNETELKILEFAEARAREIEAMDHVSRGVVGKASATQLVPNHMRRRAASHNIKRLPRRLREKARIERLTDPPKKGKRPSRKHRRRPGNLLQEYKRRKQRCMWLESHIWHAKRFHMQEMWGYKLANFPNDKSLRACYRASSRHCLMWDMSYFICIEINGKEDDIIKGLDSLTSQNPGESFGCCRCIDGSVEGTVFLHAANKYPRGAIGSATYLWKPKLNMQESSLVTSKRSLWLWVHPSIYNEILRELATIFKAELITSEKFKEETVKEEEKNTTNGGEKKVTDTICEKVKKEGSNCLDSLDTQLPGEVIYQGPDVELVSLKDTLCRFKLLGPQSQVILADMLNAGSKCFKNNNGQSASDDGSEVMEHSSRQWWESFYTDPRALELQKSQLAAWRDVGKAVYPSYVPPGTVLGLTVRDPRLSLPKVRRPVTVESYKPDHSHKDEFSDSYQWPEVSYSPIWESTVRKSVKQNKLTEQQINKKRSENYFPGSNVDLGREESQIPVLLIHKPGDTLECVPTPLSGGVPGTTHLGLDVFGSGWDLIVPGGWGMAFWLGLVYRGARVGGLRELKNTHFEAGRLSFPDYCPDCTAGLQAETVTKTELEKRYKRKPPAKRVNFEKLGVEEPFRCQWGKVNISKKGTENREWFVLRDKYLLKKLSQKLNQDAEDDFAIINSVDCTSVASGCLVAVQVKLLQRGTCSPFAHICSLNSSDLENIKADSSYRGPIEPIHKLKKSGLISTTIESVATAAAKSDSILTTSRDIIGFVNQGGFSLKLGHSAGVGYVSYEALLKLADEKYDGAAKHLVLVRTTCSRQYSFAQLSVISANLIGFL